MSDQNKKKKYLSMHDVRPSSVEQSFGRSEETVDIEKPKLLNDFFDTRYYPEVDTDDLRENYSFGNRFDVDDFQRNNNSSREDIFSGYVTEEELRSSLQMSGEFLVQDNFARDERKIADSGWLKYFFEKLDNTKQALKSYFESFFLKQNYGRAFLIFLFSIIGTSFLMYGFYLSAKSRDVKGRVLGVAEDGYANLEKAITSIKNQDLVQSSHNFENAHADFSQASQELEEMGGLIVGVSHYIPFLSKLSSGKHAADAGKHISLAGKFLSEAARVASSINNPFGDKNQTSLLIVFGEVENNLSLALSEIKKTEEELNLVKIDDLPEDKREKFIKMKNRLPEMSGVIQTFLDNGHIIADLLGANGPRKYLFLLQNNYEMRATGGFIGSYGMLDMKDGMIRKFFVDGIFNPDGQLTENIIPPNPIQKISAGWSLHDSNWFPDFPKSAKKAIEFYEKTGGPTVDGVVAITPELMKSLLEITGPISMSDYGVTIDSRNFIETVQYEVEENYDKEKNRPKQILSDLMPIVLAKIFDSGDKKNMLRAANALSDNLDKKYVLLYSSNDDLQKIISRNGWSGEVLETPMDYFSVINTNINGYKTDGVVSEKIKYEVEIQNDGSVLGNLMITRKHNGGNLQYDWWNKVNADYMRIYVPKNSVFASVEGQTREFVDPPLDYQALGFKTDQDVAREEDGMKIESASGTRIYEDFNKTVFGNWTYVSPQETMIIRYKYALPFKLDPRGDEKARSYSLLAQKQSGSFGSDLNVSIKYPKNWKVQWTDSENLKQYPGELSFSGKLDMDKFFGVVFSEN